MCSRGADVWKLVREASLASTATKIDRNRFLIKSFFRIVHSMIIKNWAYTHNFHDVVDPIGQCGGKEISPHLIIAPKNTTYISPEYINKYVTIMAEFVKKRLHSTMKNNEFTFYSDETQDITSIEQLVIYATFLQDTVVKEHFIGLIPVSKVVGTHLSAVNIMDALKRFFKDLDIPLKNAKFACMDTTNVNSGERNGLKRHLEHIAPMLRWIGCNNHKLAFCFKHLIPKFPSINDNDAFLLNLWKFFKYRPLVKNFLEERASMYGQDPVTAVCPSETHWILHERACKAFYKGYKQFLDALAVCYNERKESEALGLFILAVTPEIIATVLLLLEVFNCIRLLILFLQKGQVFLCLSQAQTVVDLTV